MATWANALSQLFYRLGFITEKSYLEKHFSAMFFLRRMSYESPEVVVT